MSATRFKATTRLSLWRANDGKCFFCGVPVAFSDLDIDHIIPETTTPSSLSELRRRIPLPDDFTVNALPNLVPTHHSCNKRKGGDLMDDQAILFYLQLWAKRQPRVQDELRRHTKSAKCDRILATISAAIESGELSRTAAVQAILRTRPGTKDEPSEPVVVSFSIDVGKLLSRGRGPSDAGNTYPQLCDRLERDLLQRVTGLAPILAYPAESSARDGETLSMRIAFWNLDVGRLDHLDIEGWSITEVARFSELYAGLPDDLLAKAVVKAHAAVVDDPTAPMGVGRCPQCGSANLKHSFATDDARDETYYMVECDECDWFDWTQ